MMASQIVVDHLYREQSDAEELASVADRGKCRWKGPEARARTRADRALRRWRAARRKRCRNERHCHYGEDNTAPTRLGRCRLVAAPHALVPDDCADASASGANATVAARSWRLARIPITAQLDQPTGRNPQKLTMR